MEDFAQIFGVYPEAKYENASARSIGRVIGAEGGEADVAEFIRRLTFEHVDRQCRHAPEELVTDLPGPAACRLGTGL